MGIDRGHSHRRLHSRAVGMAQGEGQAMKGWHVVALCAAIVAGAGAIASGSRYEPMGSGLLILDRWTGEVSAGRR